MGAVSFTSDGLKAYYTRNQKKSNGVVQLEIWESNYKEGKWLKGHKMFFNNKNYSYFHPAITPDGKRLYYVSDEPTGWGGTDIYYIDRNDDGSWKATTNAGQDINTNGNELFPTFYNDLFCFSSNGHAGLGGLDIFRVENDKNGDFVIQNMGYPINSSKDDLAFSLNESKGYFSSNRMGSDDIYSFDYTKTFIDLSGQILTGFKLMSNAKVYLFEINVHGQKVLIDSAVLDDKSNYNFKIRPNKNLQIEVNDAYGKPHSLDINSENYILHNGQYHKEIALLNLPIPEEQLRADKLKQDEIKNAELSKMSKVFIRTIDSLKSLTNDYVELHHPFDQVYIIKENLNDYYKLIERVKRMSNKKIIIVSAADCNGTLDYNEDLSTRRAKRIFKTLSSLSDNQIIIKEVGERELLKACDDLQKDINEQVVNRYSYIFILNK
jgi:outer membrane protein OmpA-like peptidoglycan-associated protein